MAQPFPDRSPQYRWNPVVSISVCMATYNGAAYVVRQLTSILEQLAPTDEIIVVDDASTDKTVAVIRGIGDARISLHANDRNRGEVHSFSRAVSLARNDFIFLADQDDVWMPGRAELMTRKLAESGRWVVTSNLEWVDTVETPIVVPYDGVTATSSMKHLRNIADIFIGRTNYFGCAMAMRREIVPLVAPIPEFVESHDLWIALASNLARSNLHIDEATLLKRKHGKNATSTVSTRSLHRKLWSRAIFALSLVVLAGRLRRVPAR